jgi:hypothetical protein
MALFLTVVGLIYGLIAAFTINNSWERFSKIRDSIAEETSSIQNLHEILKEIADKPLMKKFYNVIAEYCKGVLESEWYEYWLKEDVHKKFRELFDVLGSVKVSSPKDTVLYDQCFDEMHQASTSRTQQLVLAQTRLSKIQWTLLLFLSVILVISIIFLSLPSGILSIFVSTTMITSIVLIFFVIYELDSMKLSEREVSVEPYIKLARDMDIPTESYYRLRAIKNLYHQHRPNQRHP